MLRKQLATPARSSFGRGWMFSAVMAGCAFSAAGQGAMEMRQTRYHLRAGEAVPIAAPPETLDFLAKAGSRHVAIVTPETAVSSDGLVAGPNRTGDRILLGASLRMAPGEYSVTLSAANTAGEVRQTTLAVQVLPRVSVPSNAKRPPVV